MKYPYLGVFHWFDNHKVQVINLFWVGVSGANRVDNTYPEQFDTNIYVAMLPNYPVCINQNMIRIVDNK